MHLNFALVAFLTSGSALAAPTNVGPAAATDYYLAFQTAGTMETPMYKIAKLVTNGTDSQAILIVAGCESPSEKHRGTRMSFNEDSAGDGTCLLLTDDGFSNAGATVGTPLLGSASPAYSYPIYAIAGSPGDCRWYVSTPANETVSVFTRLYEGNEGVYACKAVVNGREETVLSLGKTGPNLDEPVGCIPTVIQGFSL